MNNYGILVIFFYFGKWYRLLGVISIWLGVIKNLRFGIMKFILD